MFRSLRSRMGSAVPSSSEQNHINGDARGDSHPASSYMPQVARDSSGANRIGSHFYPPPDDDPPPPYTETITTSDVGSRNISDQTAHVPVSESEDTTALMSVPVPACETLADNARGRATTPTIAQQASFYAPVSSSITGGFDSGNDIGDSSVETAAGSLDDYAMVHTPAHSARPVFRYQKTSEDIFSNFDLAPPPLNSVSAVASSTPRAHRGYGSIAVSILDDLDGTPFSNVADGTQDGNDALHAPVPEETGDFSFGQRYQQTEVADDHSPAVVVSHQRVHANRVSDQKECPICAETKSLSGFPIFSVTPTCLHAPETCLECLRMAIRTELNDRHWKDIRCPECRELLEYVDVQRYADEQTFTRYENLALRAAMHQADNFIWCTAGCGSGQIHDTGVEQPIVNCLHCSQRSCFTHEVAWHDGLTCDEYDSLIADPENFRSRIEIENAAIEEEGARRRAQDAADCAMARGLAASQEAEERARQQREEQERKRAVKAAEETRRAAARRKREDEKSIALVGKTTKKCPGCTWAIEKNRGCSHMTCW